MVLPILSSFVAVALEGRTLQMIDTNARLSLIPAIRVDQQDWLEPAAENCVSSAAIQTCALPGYGTIQVTTQNNRLQFSFQAERPLVLKAMGWRGTLQMAGVRGWLSQGWQSWSQTGVIQVQAEPTAAAVNQALQQTGEDEVYRRGKEISWWYSYIGSDERSFLAGASTADRLRSYVQFYRQSPDLYGVKLISGAGESVALSGGAAISESWTVSLGSNLQDHLDAYARSLQARPTHHPREAQSGWNSWYNLWDDVTEADFRANIDPVRAFWQNRPSTALTMTLDDGWEKAWGDWVPNARFPSGIKGLADALKSKGVQLGLWLAPLLAHPDSDLAKQHPEWLVQGADYRNPMGVRMRVLDVSQPAVARHLQDTIRRLVDAGAQVLKIDFLFAGALEGQRSQPWTGMQAYHEALRLIREAAGETTYLIAVGAPPLATFPYVDAWRVGGDIAFKPLLFGLPKPGAVFIANQARAIAGRQPYCQVMLCDADPALLRDLSQDEVSAGVGVAASTGGGMVLSDNMPKLDKSRWTWGYDERQLRNGLSGQPARLQSYFPPEIPVDLNSMKDRVFTAEQKVPEIWIMPDGTRVALNFGNGKKAIEGIDVPKNASRILP